MSPAGSLQYVYRWRIGQWSTLAPCVEHNSPPFDADGLCWVFKLFKGRARNPKDLALYLAVHDSTANALQRLKKKVDVSFTLENLRTRGLDYSKYTTPITVWVDSTYSTWGDDKFISLNDMGVFLADDMVCLVVRFHVRETIHVGLPPTAQPSPAIAVYVPEKISAPFNQLLKSARFSDIQFELRDSSALLLSPGPHAKSSARQSLVLTRSSGENPHCRDALRINYGGEEGSAAGHPTPPEFASDEDVRSPCVTPMPGNCFARVLPYSRQHRVGGSPPELPPAGPRYHAHKAILMAVSPVFEAMFSNGMRETYERVVEVWDVTSRAFERMLEYAYTRTCDLDIENTRQKEISSDEIVETLLCADQFEVTGLREICWRSLLARISAETVWEIWSIATDLEAHQQQRACRDFCTRRFSELCFSPATMWAPAPLLRQALISDTLNVQSEELLFETVVRWASFREDEDCVSAPVPPVSPRRKSMVEPVSQPISAPNRFMRSSSVLSAEKHTTRTGGITDEAVLTCHRSPSNLALLPPRSPWLNRRGVLGSRRKPALTREALTTSAASPGFPRTQLDAPPSPGSPKSPRMSIISATRLQSSQDPAEPPSATSTGSVWSSLFERKEFLPALLPCIRFPMMDKNFLLHVVERNVELMAMPLMKDLLIEAYRFHAFNPTHQQPPPPQAVEMGAQKPLPEQHAKKEHAPSGPTSHYAKIILPLNTTDELTLSRSQRRKCAQRLSVQGVNFNP
ncbi:hypothetical protein H4S08_003778 [Coemansia sp. RSA 1365]|nr:hypothetical protein H4S08_003778 [Coemansia sp. RSA 1365]